MLEKFRHSKLAFMPPGPELSRSDRIRKLMKLRDDARAEQRLASEGAPEGEDGSNSDLGDIDIALDRLGRSSVGEGQRRVTALKSLPPSHGARNRRT